MRYAWVTFEARHGKKLMNDPGVKLAGWWLYRSVGRSVVCSFVTPHCSSIGTCCHHHIDAHHADNTGSMQANSGLYDIILFVSHSSR
jgi:hypothetical protein